MTKDLKQQIIKWLSDNTYKGLTDKQKLIKGMKELFNNQNQQGKYCFPTINENAEFLFLGYQAFPNSHDYDLYNQYFNIGYKDLLKLTKINEQAASLSNINLVGDTFGKDLLDLQISIISPKVIFLFEKRAYGFFGFVPSYYGLLENSKIPFEVYDTEVKEFVATKLHVFCIPDIFEMSKNPELLVCGANIINTVKRYI